MAELVPRLAARGHSVEVFTSELYREFPWQRLAADVPREETTAVRDQCTAYRSGRCRGSSTTRSSEVSNGRSSGRTPRSSTPTRTGRTRSAVARRHRRRHGTPFVLTAHFHPIWSIEGGWLRHRIRGFYDRRLAGSVVQSAARIIVQTHEEERLLRTLGLPLPPVEIIPPGYTPLAARAARIDRSPGTAGGSKDRSSCSWVGSPRTRGSWRSSTRSLRSRDATQPALSSSSGRTGGWGPAVDARARELGIGPRRSTASGPCRLGRGRCRRRIGRPASRSCPASMRRSASFCSRRSPRGRPSSPPASAGSRSSSRTEKPASSSRPNDAVASRRERSSGSGPIETAHRFGRVRSGRGRSAVRLGPNRRPASSRSTRTWWSR